MHEPGVEPLRILAAEIVRSRPPTEALGSSDHGPRLEDAHAEPKRSLWYCGTRRGKAKLGLLPEFVRCRVDGVKGGAVSPCPRRRSASSPAVPGANGRDIFAQRPPGGEAASIASRVRHRLSTRDAARDAIDAARRSMIDGRASVFTAEAEGGFLLRRAMNTSRKCVLARAVSTTLASRCRRPYLLLIPRT